MTVQDDKIIDGTLYVDVIPLCDPCASDDALPIRQLQVRKVLEIALCHGRWPRSSRYSPSQAGGGHDGLHG